jgi:hypothetical protein
MLLRPSKDTFRYAYFCHGIYLWPTLSKSRIIFFLMNIHNRYRTIYFARVCVFSFSSCVLILMGSPPSPRR